MYTLGANIRQPPKVRHPNFNYDLPIYRFCCCGVDCWAYFTLFFDMFATLALYGVLLCLAYLDQEDYPKGVMTGWVIGIVAMPIVSIVLIIILAYGLRNDLTNWFLVYLVLLWIWIVVQCVGLVIVIIALISASRMNDDWIIRLVVVAVFLVFRIFLQIVLHKTLRYVRDKESHNSNCTCFTTVQDVNAPPTQSYMVPNAPQPKSYEYTPMAQSRPASAPYEAPPPPYADVKN